MNHPMVKVPMVPKDERDFFRAPSAPPPLNPLGGHLHPPPPSPIPWFTSHCSGVQSYASHLNAAAPVSMSWDSYHQQYFKAASPSTSFGSFSLYGLPCPPTSSLLSPLPAHAHSVSSGSSYLPLSLKSPSTSLSPPAAHSLSDRPYMSSPGIFRPIPSRPSSSSATPLVIPRVDFDGETKTSNRILKSEDKSAGGPIKSEPEYLNDSDSAFEDGDGSFSLCSRTTPVNHKSIKKWRQRSTPSMKPISVNTSTPLRPIKAPSEELGPFSAPGSLSSSWTSPFSSPSTGHMSSSSFSTDSSFGESNKSLSLSSSVSLLSNGFTPSKPSKPSESSPIPVGIALARLRPSHDDQPGDSSSSSDKGEDLKKEQHSSSYPLNIPKVTRKDPSTPLLPLGYQWAKDPISGQIYFLPSNPIWTSNPGYGYLQWQQDAWLAHQHLQLSLSGLNHNQNNNHLPPPFIKEDSVRVPSRASTTDEKISVGEEEQPREEEEADLFASKEKKNAGDMEEVKSEVPENNNNNNDVLNNLNGLELLTEGISRMETDSTKGHEDEGGSNKNNLSILIDAADTLEESSPPSGKDSEPIKVESPSTPKLMIPSDFNRNYRSPEAEKEAKAFIASKSGCCRSDEMDLSSPKKANGEDMEAWEIGMRMNLAEIQRKYKEKYKELYKLQKSSTQSRRRKSSSDSGTYTSKKIKTEKIEKDWSAPASFSDTFVKKYKPDRPDVVSGDLPYNWVPKKKFFLSNRKNSSDVTLFTDKFKKCRPSPFENLLRLSKNRQSLDDDDDQSEEIIKDDEEESKSMEEDDVIDEREIIGDEKVIPKVFQRVENDDEEVVSGKEDTDSSSRSYVPDEPRVVSEEVPPAVSPHAAAAGADSPPLVVSPLKIKKSIVSDSEAFECQVPKRKSKKSKKYKKNKKDKKLKKIRKMKVSVIRTPPTSSCLDITPTSLENSSPPPPTTYPKFKTMKNKSKWSSSDEEEENDINDDDLDLLDPQNPEDCLLSEHDLRDGLRVLTKIEGHFHPSTIKAISPPDIYGVVVDKERGNKPHIFSREEVLKAAIYEVKPSSIEDVPIGTRVCAYWSQKYNHLYPGTIGEPGSPNPKLDPNFFVNVELDDGDSRDIHIDSVRYLPPDYPLVQYEPDPMAFGSRRKRMFSTDSVLSTSSISSTRTNDAKDEISHKVCKNRRESSSSHVTKVIIKSSDLKFKIRSSPELVPESNSKSLMNNKSSMAAFLPAQQLWCWADEGVKKGRRIIHNSIKRDDDETLTVGTCAVFLSTGRPDRPYIGRLESLWETHGSNSMRNMRVKVRWFYHACETKGKSKDGSVVEDLSLPGALFESYHYDENDVQTISHGCDVLSVTKFFSKLSEESSRISTIYENNDLYYLAGNYDPVEENIEFYPKVFEDYKA